MAFEHDTFVCLEVPSPASDRVLEIRRQHRDEFRAALPAEITVAGSSGVGPLEPTEDPDSVYAAFDRVAQQTAPIELSFGSVVRFPNTDIFVATVADEIPFHRLHRDIAASGIRFKPTPFPFFPHCTLRSRSPISDEDGAALLLERIAGTHRLDTLSVYMFDRLPLTMLYRTRLRQPIASKRGP
jgi:2'-5' RNA ligase